MKNKLLSALLTTGALLGYHTISHSIERFGLEKGSPENNEMSILPVGDTQENVQLNLPDSGRWTNPLLPDLPENDGRNIRLNLDQDHAALHETMPPSEIYTLHEGQTEEIEDAPTLNPDQMHATHIRNMRQAK